MLNFFKHLFFHSRDRKYRAVPVNLPCQCPGQRRVRGNRLEIEQQERRPMDDHVPVIVKIIVQGPVKGSTRSPWCIPLYHLLQHKNWLLIGLGDGSCLEVAMVGLHKGQHSQHPHEEEDGTANAAFKKAPMVPLAGDFLLEHSSQR